MLTEFEKKIAAFIESQKLLGPNDRILLALSGGADSTAMLYATQALKAEGLFKNDFTCVHINHQLRGQQADADEKFTIEQAEILNLPITTKRIDVKKFAGENKLSIETAGRKLRIKTLLDIAKQNNCTQIAAAHHKNDNAETILQRLLRGTGYRGLAGIWPMRNFTKGICFVRPLLCVTRDEIIEYLNKKKLKWQTDHTNYDLSYRRNFIRHQLLPALQQQSSDSLVEQLFVLSQSARRFQNLLCEQADKIWPTLTDCNDDVVKLDLHQLSAHLPAVKVELIRKSLTTLGCGEKDLTQQHFKKILQLALQNTTGKKIQLPAGFVVSREYEHIVFTRPAKTSNKIPLPHICHPERPSCHPEPPPCHSERSEESHYGPSNSISIHINLPGQTKFANYLIEATILEADKQQLETFKAQKTKFVEWFDLDKIKLPLVVRPRQTGDKFWPLGLPGEKKVGKFLTAEKVPQPLRQKTLIVCDSEKIIWLWPIRISEKAKVTNKTLKILQLQIARDSGNIG